MHLQLILLIAYSYLAKSSTSECGAQNGTSAVPMPPTEIRVECSNLTATVWFHYKDPARTSIGTTPYEFHVQYNDDPTEPSAWNHVPYPIKVLKNNEGYVKVPLRPYTEFGFRVIARSQCGDSAPIQSETTCATEPDRPISNPSRVHTRNGSPQNLIICWQPMTKNEWDGPGFYYIVEYTQLGDQNPKFQTINAHNESDCVIISDQPTYHQYDVRVWAANSLGRSSAEPTLVKGHSGEGEPYAAPSDFGLARNSTLRGNVAKFVWRPVPESLVHGQLKRYKITHWSDNDQETEIAYFSPHATEGIVYKLSASKINYAVIAIENYSGREGPISNTISFSMQKGPPAKVDCLDVASHPSGLIYVSWKAPFSFNDVPVGFQVQWCACSGRENQSKKKAKDTNKGACEVSSILGINDTEYTILDAAPFTDYFIKVTAISLSGSSEVAMARVNVASTAALDGKNLIKPELRSILALRRETNITWIFENEGEANVQSLLKLANLMAFIKYKRKSGDHWRTTGINARQKRVFLHNLCPGVAYDVRIVYVVEIEPTVWTRSEFKADFRTAGPKSKHCVESELRVWE